MYTPNTVEFHPSKIPISKTFNIKDVPSATEGAEEMVSMKFEGREDGFKVLMPKEKKLAKRIGFTITTTINYGLKKTKQDQNIRYWTYHEGDNYAIVLVSPKVLEKLDL